jgi:hypothetical protein
VWRSADRVRFRQSKGAELQLLRDMWTNAGTARELLEFLWAQKLWWMVPMVAVLLVFGLLLIFASASGVGPFIYSLF